MKNKTYVIAEVGPNHLGSVLLAKQYIKVLSKTGVNAVKFQIGIPEEHYSLDSFFPKYQIKRYPKGFKLFDVVKKRLLKLNEHKELYEECKKYKIDYLCSAFDLKSLKYLNENFKLKYFKIPSSEILSTDQIDYASKSKKDIILSTGMAQEQEIEYAINRIKKFSKNKVILLHCVSSYPTEIKDINLNYLLKLKEKFNCEIGFSDHSMSNLSAVIAVSLGAKIIEKHVTFDKDLDGPDHLASLEIKDLKNFVKSIRETEIILGKAKKILSSNEIGVKKSLRKSCVASKNLTKGKIFSKKDFVIKRPGTGISPILIDKFIGKKIKSNIKKDRLIKRNHF